MRGTYGSPATHAATNPRSRRAAVQRAKMRGGSQAHFSRCNGGLGSDGSYGGMCCLALDGLGRGLLQLP